MSQEKTITTLFQLQEKYECIMTSYYEPITKALWVTATLNSNPRFNVARKISKDELENQANKSTLEEQLYIYISNEFEKFMQNTNADISNCVWEQEKDNVISLIEWKRRMNYGDE